MPHNRWSPRVLEEGNVQGVSVSLTDGHPEAELFLYVICLSITDTHTDKGAHTHSHKPNLTLPPAFEGLLSTRQVSVLQTRRKACASGEAASSKWPEPQPRPILTSVQKR